MSVQWSTSAGYLFISVSGAICLVSVSLLCCRGVSAYKIAIASDSKLACFAIMPLQFSKMRVRDSSAEAVIPSYPASSASIETSFLHVASAVALSIACCGWLCWCRSDVAVRVFVVCDRALGVLLPEGWPAGLLTSDIVVFWSWCS